MYNIFHPLLLHLYFVITNQTNFRSNSIFPPTCFIEEIFYKKINVSCVCFVKKIYIYNLTFASNFLIKKKVFYFFIFRTMPENLFQFYFILYIAISLQLSSSTLKPTMAHIWAQIKIFYNFFNEKIKKIP